MDYFVEPDWIPQGEIAVPGDKSISHRAMMFAAIADGESEIHGFLQSTDCLATMNAVRALGAHVSHCADVFKIRGCGQYGLSAADHDLDLGNSGTGMRLLAGLLVGQSFNSCLCGDPSLHQRPMGRITDPLIQMGASIEDSAGKPPIYIYGGQRLRGLNYCSPIASAQVKSAVLIAALYAQGETQMSEPQLSRDHTERLFPSFGITIQRENNQVSLCGGQHLRAARVDIAGDFSSAIFFIVAAVIARQASIFLPNINVNPTRIGALDILRQMGADIVLTNCREHSGEPIADIKVNGGKDLQALTLPAQAAVRAIDDWPALFIAAACAQGVTKVRGIAELRVKETDRIAAMAEGLQVLGIKVQALSDSITIEGGVMGGGTVDSYGDHRIAMAFSCAAARAQGEIRVRQCDNVDTSFPYFVQAARDLQLPIREIS